MNHRIWQRTSRLWIGLLIALITACATSESELSPVPTPDSQLWADDFSVFQKNWALFDTDEMAAYVQQGELYLEDRGKGIAVYAPLVGQTYEDVDVTVQIRHVQGSMDNWMGVVCRLQDEANYYLFAISADGHYLIQKVEDDVVLPIAGPQFSDAINVGKAKNQLSVRCEGDVFSLRVNRNLLITRTDAGAGASGQIALFADAVDSGGTVVVAFDNFVLSAP